MSRGARPYNMPDCRLRRSPSGAGSGPTEGPMSSEAPSTLTQAAAIPELDILWVTAGLSCDGDTVSMTAATQPSIEDVLLGAIPGLPRVNLHNPVLAYRNGADFLNIFHRAAAGQVEPFVLVVEGSIPNEKT